MSDRWERRCRVALLGWALVLVAQAIAGCGGASRPASRAGSLSAICEQRPPIFEDAGTLIQFVSRRRGWALVGRDLLSTDDGGAHWRIAYRAAAQLIDEQFVGPDTGWLVETGGPDPLLESTDGGRHWQPLGDACHSLVHVDFVNRRVGYAVASTGAGPAERGLLLATSDGGRDWRREPAPADVQSVCFVNPGDGWLGGGRGVYSTTTGGRRWSRTLGYPMPATVGEPAQAVGRVACAGRDGAWAVVDGGGAGMNQEPHVGYHFDGARWQPLYAEWMFEPDLPRSVPEAPGAYSGPFDAISSSAAVFIDSCSPCGDGLGSAPYAVVTGGGRQIADFHQIPGINMATAVSFINPRVGWVIGEGATYSQRAGYNPDAFTRIAATTDGGAHWRLQVSLRSANLAAAGTCLAPGVCF